LKLPRDLSGQRFAQLLRSYGYEITRQTGSHIRLTSKIKGAEHHITIPAHDALKVGTLSAILGEVASYLEIDRSTLAKSLFSSR
jgi:predicted RNA binding protein YcfA (HicA-like mRNA interferase family)